MEHKLTRSAVVRVLRVKMDRNETVLISKVSDNVMLALAHLRQCENERIGCQVKSICIARGEVLIDEE